MYTKPLDGEVVQLPTRDPQDDTRFEALLELFPLDTVKPLVLECFRQVDVDTLFEDSRDSNGSTSSTDDESEVRDARTRMRSELRRTIDEDLAKNPDSFLEETEFVRSELIRHWINMLHACRSRTSGEPRSLIGLMPDARDVPTLEAFFHECREHLLGNIAVSAEHVDELYQAAETQLKERVKKEPLLLPLHMRLVGDDAGLRVEFL